MIHNEIPESYIKSEFDKLYEAREAAKSVIEREKEKHDKEVKLIKNLRKVDRALRKMDGSFAFELGTVQMSVTGNRSETQFGNSKMADFGLSNQKIKITKVGMRLNANIFGITANTYFSTSQLFSFGNQFAEAAKIYADNMAVQMSMKEYKHFIKTVDKCKELYPAYTEEQLQKVF